MDKNATGNNPRNSDEQISDSQKKMNLGTAEVSGKNDVIKKSEDSYHSMIEEIEDYAILLMDSDGYILNWNKGAEKIKGYKEAEILGCHFRLFYLQNDQKSQLPEHLIEQAKKNGKAVHEGWRVCKNGTTFWGSTVLTAIHNNAGEVTGFSKVTRDLTERKTAEDKMKQYAQELEVQNRELQQFAYAAAHDMREPLRKIRYYTSTVLEELAARLSDKEILFLKRTVDASARMQSLIEDLLAYTQISGKTGILEEIDLNLYTEEVLSNNQEIIESINAEIKSDPLPVITGISFQIRQLLDNLIANSLKYHEPTRKLQIRISSEKHPVFIHTQGFKADQLYYKITIQDNGIGFDQQFKEKIFEMFERLHGREDYSGSGIGLTLCRKIVQNHGGLINALSEVGKGTTFTIFLPVTNA